MGGGTPVLEAFPDDWRNSGSGGIPDGARKREEHVNGPLCPRPIVLVLTAAGETYFQRWGDESTFWFSGSDNYRTMLSLREAFDPGESVKDPSRALYGHDTPSCDTDGTCGSRCRLAATARHNCSTDGDCSKTEFCLGGVCVNPCNVLNPCERSLRNGICAVEEHRPVCRCPDGFVNMGVECKPVRCMHKGKQHSYADSVYEENCEQRCTCSSSGEMVCNSDYTCLPGFFRVGSYSRDPLCFENKNEPFADECCVTVVCAGPKGQSGAEDKDKDKGQTKAEDSKGSSGGDEGEAVAAGGEGEEPAKNPMEPSDSSSTSPTTPTPTASISPEASSPLEASTSPTAPSASTDGASTPASSTPPTSTTATTPKTTTASPTLDIVSITHNSTTLRLPGTQGGTLYMVVRGDFDGENTQWNKLLVPSGAHSYTVMHLRPSTEYLFRWNSVESTAPMATLRTQDGCVAGDLSYGLGHSYPAGGCASICRCLAPGGRVECTQRCRHVRGQITLQPGCVEAPDPADPECCVVQQCHPPKEYLMLIHPREKVPLRLGLCKAADVAQPGVTKHPWHCRDAVVTSTAVVTMAINSLHDEGRDPPCEPHMRLVGPIEGLLHSRESYARYRSISRYHLGAEEARSISTPPETPPSDASSTSTPTAATSKPTATASTPSPDGNSELRPKLIVTERTQDSVSLAWDDFSPPSYSHGYVVQYRQANATQGRTWQPLPVTGQLPHATIRSLVPSTTYQVRVSIYDDFDSNTLGLSTATINITTRAGCVFNGTTHEVGAELVQGCEAQCMCHQNGSVTCSERCQYPYFQRGTSHPDPYCSEQAVDECCALMACEGAADEDRIVTEVPDPSMHHVTELKACKYNNETFAVGEDFHDGCEYKCTCTASLEIQCEPRCSLRADATAPPSCMLEPDPNDECCSLLFCPSGVNGTGAMVPREGGVDGFVASVGCGCGASGASEVVERRWRLQMPSLESTQAVTLPFAGCKYENQTLKANETFNKGCEETCRCMGFGDISCFPRCPPPSHGGNRGISCVTLPDPTDPCCTITVCGETQSDVMKANTSEAQATSTSTLSSTTVILTSSSSVATSTPTPSTSPPPPPTTPPTPGCKYESKQFNVGSEFFMGCSARCLCVGTNVYQCVPRCLEHRIPAGFNCTYQPDPSDSCCTIPLCTPFREVPEEPTGCTYDGEVIPVGTEFNKGCEERCFCVGSGIEHCAPRCPRIDPLFMETCTQVPDPGDPCCNALLCPEPIPLPTLPDESQDGETSTVSNTLGGQEGCLYEGTLYPLGTNYTKGCEERCVCLGPGIEHCFPRCEDITPKLKDGCTVIPDPADKCCQNLKCPEKNPRLEDSGNSLADSQQIHCSYEGKLLSVYERVYNECVSFCMCMPSGEMECAAVECPDAYSLEYLHPECYEWGPNPATPVEPPNCCPHYVCLNDGTCEYKGETFDNFEEIPESLTGCQKRCMCEFGNISCHDVCPPVAEKPPLSLPCPPQIAFLEEEGCCQVWKCPSSPFTPTRPPPPIPGLLDADRFPMFPPQNTRPTKPNFPLPPTLQIDTSCAYNGKLYGIGQSWEVGASCQRKTCTCTLHPNGTAGVECQGGCADVASRALEPSPECPSPYLFTPTDPCICPFVMCNASHSSGQRISDLRVHPINATAVQITFSLPPIYVGLSGDVEVLYDYKSQEKSDPTQWDSTFWMPEGEVFASKRQVFTLNRFKPATKGPSTTKPPHVPTTSLPSKLNVDANLEFRNLQPTSVFILWRKFRPFERQFIDAIQLRYRNRDENSQVPKMTPLLHPENTEYELRGLTPDTEYEVDIAFSPFPNQTTDLVSDTPLYLHTPPLSDIYNFSMMLEIPKMSSRVIELRLNGIPQPPSKYVNVYRVLHKAMNRLTPEEQFVLPKVDPPAFTIEGLKPSTEYQIWVEAFLRNGKILPSNVIDRKTPSDPYGAPDNPKETQFAEKSHATVGGDEGGSYYVPMIILAIVVVVLIVLSIAIAILCRRQSRAKAPISSPRHVNDHELTTQSYNNPSFKHADAEGNYINGKDSTKSLDP
ncbi:unnamed protein product [Darwinula stevensoni]|uniref:Fibronectin type-III domain-containing protein n=1 Tax=Darwinula stevensoni TaxID=69355 RepID=A0A7R8XA82_9CRUS|nr:unnamed protein product [Darwinula stevensoni]CAG0885187.1 unnamed protein product [Darwinula stevensoni]